MYSADFLIFRRISVTRQLVLLTSIVYFFPTMEVNETRNSLVTDILLNIRKSLTNIFLQSYAMLVEKGSVLHAYRLNISKRSGPV